MEMPSDTPSRGFQPPRNVTAGHGRPIRSMNSAPTKMTPPAEVTIATMSSRRREIGIEATKRAPTRNGPAMTSGATEVTSVAQRVELVRVERAEALLRLHGDGEQQGGHGGAHDDVGERQGLDDRVDRLRVRRDVDEDRGRTVRAVADREEQEIRRALHDRDADDEVH